MQIQFPWNSLLTHMHACDTYMSVGYMLSAKTANVYRRNILAIIIQYTVLKFLNIFILSSQHIILQIHVGKNHKSIALIVSFQKVSL